MKITLTTSGEDERVYSVSMESQYSMTKEEIIQWFDNMALPGIGYERTEANYEKRD